MKNGIFLSRKPIHFFKEKQPFFERFEKSYYFSCILQKSLYFWRFLQKFFFRKIHILYLILPILNVSRGPIFSVAFHRKFARFSDFFQKKSIFFSKNPPYFSIKKHKFWRFFGIFTISVEIYWNYATFAVFLSKTVMSEKPIFFAAKNLIF